MSMRSVCITSMHPHRISRLLSTKHLKSKPLYCDAYCKKKQQGAVAERRLSRAQTCSQRRTTSTPSASRLHRSFYLSPQGLYQSAPACPHKQAHLPFLLLLELMVRAEGSSTGEPAMAPTLMGPPTLVAHRYLTCHGVARVIVRDCHWVRRMQHMCRHQTQPRQPLSPWPIAIGNDTRVASQHKHLGAARVVLAVLHADAAVWRLSSRRPEKRSTLHRRPRPRPGFVGVGCVRPASLPALQCKRHTWNSRSSRCVCVGMCVCVWVCVERERERETSRSDRR